MTTLQQGGWGRAPARGLEEFSVREEKGSSGLCFSQEEAGQGWCSQCRCLHTHREASVSLVKVCVEEPTRSCMCDAHQPWTAKPIQHHPSQAWAQPTWTFLGWLPHRGERAPMEKDLFYCMFARGISKLLLKRPPPGRCAAQSTIPRVRLPACLWPSPWLPCYLLPLRLTRRDTRLLPPRVCIRPGKPLRPHGPALTPALVCGFSATSIEKG